MFLGIKDFRANDHEFTVAGDFSDGTDFERCYISSGLVESFLGMSPRQCAQQLNGEKNKVKRKEMKTELCYRFLSFKGSCDVTALRSANSLGAFSNGADIRYTITNYYAESL